jgi:hypothetical protein
MDGNNGGWAVLAEVPSETSMKVAIGKDQVTTNVRYRTAAELDYIVFSAAGPVALIPTAAAL